MKASLPRDRFQYFLPCFALDKVKKGEISGIGSELKVSPAVSLERLKVIFHWQNGRKSEFQSLEVVGINKSASAIVRLVFNLIAKGC